MKRGLRRSGAITLAAAAMLGTTAGIADADSGGFGTSSHKAGGKDAFPVRGHHTYGDGIGAGRGHQGQDILAACGKKVVAAKAGRVRTIDYQGSGAGNYVVIDGKKFDYVYMHLLRKPKLRKGERLGVGEKIGLVGSTGRSSACHLHFEMWSKPGWYQGGSVVNPLRFLKSWDRN